MSTSNYALGAQVPLTMYVRDINGALTNASTTVLTITLPDGTTVTPSWSTAVTGTYTYNYTTTVAGNHSWVGTSTGPVTSTDPERFRVRDTLADYATLNDLKSYLGIADTVDDNQLYIALDAAQAWIDVRYQSFARASTPTARVFRNGAEEGLLTIDPVSTATGLVVKASAGDGTYTTVPATSYITYPDNATAYGKPITGIRFVSVSPYVDEFGVQVTAAWGWPTVPAEVTEATLLLAARLFKRKNSPEGVAGFGDLGVVRVTKDDNDVLSLLSAYDRTVSMVF